ncbi:MAG: RNA polymerase sigma factor (sigma-70 family) [Planctomycetota bacterium]|jgi:RNA polymerase sigma factor (sigma-70 family)
MSYPRKPQGPEQDVLECEQLVRRVSRSLARDWNDADDLAQDSWLAVLHSAPDNLRSPSRWMARIARRGAAGQTRARLRRNDVELLSYENKAQASPLEELSLISERGEVRQALDDLAAKYREVIQLRYFEDLSHQEITKRLDLPLETVRTRLKRALSKLRKSFEVDGQLDRRRWCLLMAGLVHQEQRLAGVRTVQVGSGLGAGAVGFGVALMGAFLVATAIFGGGWGDQGSLADLAPVLKDLDRGPAGFGVQVDGSRAVRSVAEAVEASIGASRVGVHVRAASDRSPLAGVVLRLERLDGGASQAVVRTSDAQGLAHLGFASTGDFLLTTDLGHERVLQLTEGQAQELELLVQGDLTILGQTQSADGAMLPQAEVWIYPQGDAAHGRVATLSDSQGRFELHGVPAGACLGTKAVGRVPGDLLRAVDLARVEGAESTLSAVLHTDGLSRECCGTITDEYHQPIAGARVQSQPVQVHSKYRFSPGGGVTLAAAAPVTYTDEEGRFRLESVRASNRILEVSAEGFVSRHIVQGLASVAAPQSGVIRLSHGSQVSGRVLGLDGMPLAGAQLKASSNGTAAVCLALSEDDGSFRLSGLASGEYKLSAVHGAAGAWAYAASTLQVYGPSTHSWDPELSPGESVSGLISFEGGGSLAGYSLELIEEGPPAGSILDRPAERGELLRLGMLGKFSYASDAAGPFELRLWAPEADVVPVHRWQGIEKGADLLELTVAATLASRAGVFGTLLADRFGADHLELWSPALRAPLVLDALGNGGSFEAAELLPGSYELLYFSPVRAPVRLRKFELVAGGRLDLGELEVPASSSIRIELVGGDEHTLSMALQGKAYLGGLHGRKLLYHLGSSSECMTRTSERELVFTGLAPGISAFSLSGVDMVWLQQMLELKPGEETLIRWDITLGISTVLEFTFPAEFTSSGEAFTIFRSDAGETFVRKAAVRPGLTTAYRGEIVLRPGKWTVEAVSGNWHTVTSFEVPSSQVSSGATVYVGVLPWEPSDAAAAFGEAGNAGFRAMLEYALE